MNGILFGHPLRQDTRRWEDCAKHACMSLSVTNRGMLKPLAAYPNHKETNVTTLLCNEDAYLREFDAVVTVVTDKGVVLDRTAFYPGGGGTAAGCGDPEGGYG